MFYNVLVLFSELIGIDATLALPEQFMDGKHNYVWITAVVPDDYYKSKTKKDMANVRTILYSYYVLV